MTSKPIATLFGYQLHYRKDIDSHANTNTLTLTAMVILSVIYCLLMANIGINLLADFLDINLVIGFGLILFFMLILPPKLNDFLTAFYLKNRHFPKNRPFYPPHHLSILLILTALAGIAVVCHHLNQQALFLACGLLTLLASVVYYGYYLWYRLTTISSGA